MKKVVSVSIFENLNKIFNIVFASVFALILLNIVFNKEVYSHNTFIMLLLIAVFITLIALFGYWFYKNEEVLQRHFSKIALATALFLFAVQMLMLPLLRFDPIFDLEAIYRGAIEMSEGRSFADYRSNTCHTDYFYIFPNNLGSMTFLAAIFKIAGVFGIKDYFTVASVVNSLMSVTTMLLTAHIAKRFFNVAGGLTVLLIFLLSPPFYFSAPVFYTDSLSLVFPAAAFTAFLNAVEKDRIAHKLLWYAVCALMCSLGALIKMTVLIFAVAAAIYLVLNRKWKDIALFGIITVAVTAILFATFNAWIYSKDLSKDKAEQMNTPIYYWIDLAFHGNGVYNNNIYQLSRNESDPELRKQILKDDIKDTVQDLGIGGIYELFENKSARAFGDGTYALSDFLDDRPANSTSLHEAITYNGKSYAVYSVISTAVFLAVQILMIISSIMKQQDKRILIAHLSVFGIMLFLLFWEVNSRYITTFIPFIFISAAGGLCGGIENKIKTK